MVTDMRGPTGRRVLGTECCPGVLTRAAHDHEVAVAGREPVDDARRTTPAQHEPAPAPERHGDHEGVGEDLRVAVTVPGDAVRPVAVQVDPDAVELHAVPLVQRVRDLAQPRRRVRVAERRRPLRLVTVHLAGPRPHGLPGRVADAPPRGQPRLRDDPVVHPQFPLPPRPGL